jgi:hypothetical protein
MSCKSFSEHARRSVRAEKASGSRRDVISMAGPPSSGGMAMHRAEIDEEHNRLILRWIDSQNISEIDQLQAEVESLLPKLRQGFDCISDIANMRPASRQVAEHIEQLQAFLHNAGMRRVVRIVGKSGGGHMASTQMDRLAAQAGYETIHVDTEAEALLALTREAGA